MAHGRTTDVQGGGVEALSPTGRTLTQVLLERARNTPEAPHLHLWQDEGPTDTLTYAQLRAGAAVMAERLAECGVRPHDTVACMLPTGREFFFTFFGTLAAGAVPVPIYPPFRADRLAEYAERQTAILQNARARALVTFRQAERLARLLKPRVPSLAVVLTADSLTSPARTDGRAADDAWEERPAAPDDTVLIQYTSGSTGEPRGVELSHKNILANLVAIGRGVGVRADDVTVCWLPLYHDMGLIGCWLFSLYFGLPIVALSPTEFLRRPVRWLRAIERFRGTLSPAPNFAYELCVRKINAAALEGLDLNSWRVALNGAEPISPDTIARFTERFGPFGFRPETMMPVYGLAETSVALAFSPRGRAPRIDRVGRETFQRSRRAQPVPSEQADSLSFVSVGRPLPEHEVRVVDDNEQVVGERMEGHLQFRGPSTTRGYYRNPEATAELFSADGWCRTGDLGYRAEGELFITGRTKDLIIQAGRNIYPQEIEEVAAAVEGVRRGCVAAFSVPEPNRGTEALVLLAETRETNQAVRARIASEIMRRVGSVCRVSPEVVRLVAPQTIPKTPSGKLRRGASRELYLRNALEGARAPAWWQAVQLAGASAWALLRGSLARTDRPTDKT